VEVKGVHSPVKLPRAFPALFIIVAVTMILFSQLQLYCHAGGTKVIAAVMSSDQPRYREAHQAFIKSLAARGYTSADTEIFLHFPNTDSLSWSATFHKITAYHPDLIMAYGASASHAAMKEIEGIPIVSVDMYAAEPPARGTCGVSSRVPMITLLKTLQDIGQYRRIGVILNAREIDSQRQLEDIRKYAFQLGMSVIEGNVTSGTSVDNVLTALFDKVDVIIAATESGIIYRQFDRIVARAKTRKIPVVTTMPNAAVRGALVSLEINPQEQGHLAAEIATRILEGAHAEHLSLLTPRVVDLVISQRVAREMGITISSPVLGRATRIVR
jgi:putative ABC transport system substrate-binding protein